MFTSRDAPVAALMTPGPPSLTGVGSFFGSIGALSAADSFLVGCVATCWPDAELLEPGEGTLEGGPALLAVVSKADAGALEDDLEPTSLEAEADAGD